MPSFTSKAEFQRYGKSTSVRYGQPVTPVFIQRLTFGSFNVILNYSRQISIKSSIKLEVSTLDELFFCAFTSFAD